MRTSLQLFNYPSSEKWKTFDFLEKKRHSLNGKCISNENQISVSSSYRNDQLQNTIVSFIEHYRNIYATPENFIKRKVDYSRMKVFDEKYRKESERLKTFKEYPLHLAHLVKPIAKSGFYFIGNDKECDKVKCIFCQGILSDWKKTDKPIKEHKKNFPTCPFLLNLNVGNEPMKEEGTQLMIEDPNLKGINGYISYNVIKSQPQMELSNKIRFDVDWREKSFKQPFKHLKKWSLNGLFINFIDNIFYLQCHDCRKRVEVLKDVEKLEEHLFHHANCQYVNKTTTQYIEYSFDSGKSENIRKINCQVEYSISKSEIEARWESRLINLMKKMNYDEKKVMKVIEKRLKEYGKDYDSMFEFLMDLKYFKEESKENIISKDLEYILFDYSCVVCLDKAVEIVFLPCGHLKTCHSCSSLLTNCPVCRKFIEKRVRGIALCKTNNVKTL